MHDKHHLFKLNETFNELYKEVFDVALTNFDVKEKEKQYIFAFYTQGVIGIIKKWIENNCQDEIDIIIDIIERNTFVNK